MTWREGGDLDSKKKEEEAKNDLEEEEEEEEGRKSAGHSQQLRSSREGQKCEKVVCAECAILSECIFPLSFFFGGAENHTCLLNCGRERGLLLLRCLRFYVEGKEREGRNVMKMYEKLTTKEARWKRGGKYFNNSSKHFWGTFSK